MQVPAPSQVQNPTSQTVTPVDLKKQAKLAREQKKAMVAAEIHEDRLGRTKTIYEANVFEIVFKNFLAGFSRALGIIVVYLLLILAVFFFFVRYVLPSLQEKFADFDLNKLLNPYGSILEQMPKMNSSAGSLSSSTKTQSLDQGTNGDQGEMTQEEILKQAGSLLQLLQQQQSDQQTPQ